MYEYVPFDIPESPGWLAGLMAVVPSSVPLSDPCTLDVEESQLSITICPIPMGISDLCHTTSNVDAEAHVVVL
jgi:hypothetical protein